MASGLAAFIAAITLAVSPQPDAGNSFAEYLAMRAAFLQRIQEDYPRPDSEDETVDLGNCDLILATVPEEELEQRGDHVFLAFDAAWAEFYLSGSGFDARSWRDRLRTFERAEYQRLVKAGSPPEQEEPDYEAYPTTRFFRQLVADLNAERNGRRPRLTYDCDGAGTGFDDFELATAPPGAELYVISRWGSLVCAGQNIPVYDRRRCTGWRVVGTPSMEVVTGDLLYWARWPDRRISHGELIFRDRPEVSKVTISPLGPSFEHGPPR